ncbi:unnamed protein product [Thelazia callipaeda]|uniref:MADF domain-containing protein n=1 Tax=Thelazia callipaeda TaxID=103827 RepID=A0A158RC55_THECL|nr:unnamed protein product [Thelazia callipaeda]
MERYRSVYGNHDVRQYTIYITDMTLSILTLPYLLQANLYPGQSSIRNQVILEVIKPISAERHVLQHIICGFDKVRIVDNIMTSGKRIREIDYMPAVQIESAIGQHSGGTTTTTLSTTVASGTIPAFPTSRVDETFTRRLIEAVKAQPCLYNPSHEHYGNKHSSAQYRMLVWQNIRDELNFKDDVHTLQILWKRIRDRYVRERRKRRNVIIGENTQDFIINSRESHLSSRSNRSIPIVTNISSSPQFDEMMCWIEPFLLDNINSHSQLTSVDRIGNCGSSVLHQHKISQGKNGCTLEMVAPATLSDCIAHSVPLSFSNDVKEEAFDQNTSVSSTDSCLTVNSYQQTSPFQIINVRNPCEYNSVQSHRYTNGSDDSRNAVPSSSSATGGGSPCSSTTSSEIDVGTSIASTSHSNQQQLVLQQHCQQQSLNQLSSGMVVLTAIQSQQSQQVISPQQHSVLLSKSEQRARAEQQLQTSDGGVVTVTARGVAPVNNVIKRDVNVRTNDGSTVTMIIDPTTFYQHGSQKMYRLVNVSELNTDPLSLSASNNNLLNVSGELKIVGIQRRKRTAANILGVCDDHGQVSDNILLDHGITEKSIALDHEAVSGNDKIILDQHSASGPNLVLSHDVQQQLHPQASTSHTHSEITVSPHRSILPEPHVSHIGKRNSDNVHFIIGQQQTSSLSMRHQTGHQFGTQAVSVEQPHYSVLSNQSLQEEHEANLAFANSIASHLSRLNDDEKAVAKMNIQRILMDARFGIGACARMIHDEEFNEAGISTTSHDISLSHSVERGSRQP